MRKQRMQGVQLENGYTSIANELLFEFASRSNVSAHEKDILLVVLRFTYGWFRQKKACLTTGTLSRYTGLTGHDARKAVNGLLNKKILLLEKENVLAINKNSQEWLGVPRRGQADQVEGETQFKKYNAGTHSTLSDQGTNHTHTRVRNVPINQGTNHTRNRVRIVPSDQGTNHTHTRVRIIPKTGYESYPETALNSLPTNELQVPNKGNKGKKERKKQKREETKAPLEATAKPQPTTTEVPETQVERVDIIELDREFAKEYHKKTGTGIDLVMAESIRMEIWRELFATYSRDALLQALPGFFTTDDGFFSGSSGKVALPWTLPLFRTWLRQGRHIGGASHGRLLVAPRDQQVMNRQIEAALQDHGFTVERAREAYYRYPSKFIVLQNKQGYYRPENDPGWDAFVEQQSRTSTGEPSV